MEKYFKPPGLYYELINKNVLRHKTRQDYITNYRCDIFHSRTSRCLKHVFISVLSNVQLGNPNVYNYCGASRIYVGKRARRRKKKRVTRARAINLSSYCFLQ